MNKTHAFAAIALSLSVLAGCSRASAPPPPRATAIAEAPEPAADGARGASGPSGAGGEAKAGLPLAAGRALVVTMDLGAAVDDVDAATSRVRGEVERLGGYVANANAYGSGSDRSATLQLRVPSDKVRELRKTLGGVGEITSDVEKVEDVTEERADLDARLRNARVQEKRILEIMSDKTGTITAVLEAERELSRVRESIERLEAQQRTMNGRIDLATVNVSLTTRTTPAWQTPGTSIAHAGAAGVRGAAAFGVYAAMAFAATAPFLLPLGLLVTVLVMAVRGKRRRVAQAFAG